MAFVGTHYDVEHSCLLQVMSNLKLLPLSEEEVDAKVNTFRHYTDEVCLSCSQQLNRRTCTLSI